MFIQTSTIIALFLIKLNNLQVLEFQNSYHSNKKAAYIEPTLFNVRPLLYRFLDKLLE